MTIIFNLLSLLGGLAMFLYGMRLMGDGLKEGSSGALKVVMEKVTNNPVKAFLLGLGVTALIQSSTATIVITSGLVGAGIITLRQSLGIIVGANVGTTVTGQIIRLLDISSDSAAWLQIFRPSTLAPLALIVGVVLLMGVSFRNAKTVGHIALGFGILFSGLLNMTASVDTLSDMGIFESLFASLGDNPVLGYLTGAGVSFVLQSSSAAIGILQAFSASGQLQFNAIYAVIVGIYLGDCVTTAIVCSIGARPEARRVGVVNILFNLSKSALVLAAVALLRYLGVLDGLWERVVNSGTIANTNTVFNLGCAICLFPLLPSYETLSRRIIRDKQTETGGENSYADKLEALSPAFYDTPALALRSCYDLLLAMFYAACANIRRAFRLLRQFDAAQMKLVSAEEDEIDRMADRLGNYLVTLSSHLSAELHISILNQYHKLVTEFERLGDHAMNIAETGRDMADKQVYFSEQALGELEILEDLIERILRYTEQAFKTRDLSSARHIEPLEQVVDDVVYAFREEHLARLRSGACSVDAGTSYMNVLADVERISDVCSNVGVSVVARVSPSQRAHDYISLLHAGHDERFNREYRAAHEEYFRRIGNLTAAGQGSEAAD
ncbi:MAG: Na/Pi cotransporter family protein [Oscillospiraceae bacterium]|nr:Na/Pi cotransporter family protein [Oscillospiraceae bacterium]